MAFEEETDSSLGYIKFKCVIEQIKMEFVKIGVVLCWGEVRLYVCLTPAERLMLRLWE